MRESYPKKAWTIEDKREITKKGFKVWQFQKKSVFLQLKFSCNESERKTNKTLT